MCGRSRRAKANAASEWLRAGGETGVWLALPFRAFRMCWGRNKGAEGMCGKRSENVCMIRSNDFLPAEKVSVEIWEKGQIEAMMRT